MCLSRRNVCASAWCSHQCDLRGQTAVSLPLLHQLRLQISEKARWRGPLPSVLITHIQSKKSSDLNIWQALIVSYGQKHTYYSQCHKCECPCEHVYSPQKSSSQTDILWCGVSAKWWTSSPFAGVCVIVTQILQSIYGSGLWGWSRYNSCCDVRSVFTVTWGLGPWRLPPVYGSEGRTDTYKRQVHY